MERNGKPPEPEEIAAERRQDLEWIGEHLLLLQVIAQTGFLDWGRGAVGIDKVTKIEEYPGHPFNYLPEQIVYEFLDNHTHKMVKEYDPAWEMVTILFKEDAKLSSYRLGVPYQKSDSHRKK